MKVLLYLFIIASIIFGFACNTKPKISEEEKGHADSLMKVINLPELTALNKKILDDPNNPELYNQRAKIYLQYKQFEEAINDANRAIRIDTNQASFYLTKVDVYFANNETRNAKDVLENAIIRFPENTDILLKLAEIYYFVKQYENAFAKINTALKINENLAKGYYLKGNIYKETGDTGKAISSLQTAIEQDNKNAGIYVDLGLIYAGKKNPLAFEYYNTAISLDPKNTQALYAKAKLHQDLAQYKEAEELYKQITTINPYHSSSFYNLGAIEFSVKNNPTSAIDYFTRAIAANERYAEAYFARGACYQALNENEKASLDYQICLKLSPNNENAIEGLNSLNK